MQVLELSDVPRVPRMDEYFGLWAMYEATFLAAFERIARSDLKAHVETTARPVRTSYLVRTAARSSAGGSKRAQADAQDQPYLAVIAMTGSLMKQVGSLEDGSSTIQLRRDIRTAAADSLCTGILLLIDSPGGTVSGTSDLAGEVTAAKASKPVYGFVEDLAASAAYWVASCCTKIFANAATALVGSIGTYAGLYDLSGAAAMQGVKAKLYKTGPLKGAGFPGTEITPAQDAAFQEMVDQTQTHFAAAVKANRKLTDAQLAAVSTGGIWLASAAQQMGLIDGIQSFEQTLAKLQAAAERRSGGGGGSGAGGAKAELRAADAGCDCACNACADGNCADCSCDGCELCQSGGCGCEAGAGAKANQPPEGGTPNVTAGALPAANEDSGTQAGANKEVPMSTEKTAPGATAPGPKAATSQELKAALPNSTAEFRERCVEGGKTLEQAALLYAQEKDEQIASAAATTAAKGPPPGGVKAVAGGKAPTGASAEAGDFDALVRESMAKNPKLERREAIKIAAKQHPEAYGAFKAQAPKAVRA